MEARRWLALVLALGCLFEAIDASPGDFDPLYRSCVEQCQKTGIIDDSSIQHCQFPYSDIPVDSPWYMQEPLYLQWKQLNCKTDCRYNCMMQREKERGKLGLNPVKYHGKWPFKRVFVFQEPLSAVLSALNLLTHFTGWLSFLLLVNYKLPLRPQSKRTYYEYTGLWHIYAVLSMNTWFWSAIFHTRDFDLTEKLDYSSAVASLGFSFILCLLRTFNVKDEASRVMLAAPILAFVTTHILYLNFYQLDYARPYRHGNPTPSKGIPRVGSEILWTSFQKLRRRESALRSRAAPVFSSYPWPHEDSISLGAIIYLCACVSGSL